MGRLCDSCGCHKEREGTERLPDAAATVSDCTPPAYIGTVAGEGGFQVRLQAVLSRGMVQLGLCWRGGAAADVCGGAAVPVRRASAPDPDV